jgi:hypothetical protein
MTASANDSIVEPDEIPWKDPGFRRGRDVILACGQVLAREVGHTRESDDAPLLLARLLDPKGTWPWRRELAERLQTNVEDAMAQGRQGLVRLCRLILRDWQEYEAAQQGRLVECGEAGPALLALLGAGYVLEGMGNGFSRVSRLFALLDSTPSGWLEMMQGLVRLTGGGDRALLFEEPAEGPPGPRYDVRFGLTPRGMALLGIPPADTRALERAAESAQGGLPPRDERGRYHPRSSRRPKPPSAAPEETAEPSDLLLLENPGLKLSDLVVPEETRLELGFLVQMLRARPGEAPVMLFHGPPGTGKTHAARCLAGELDRPLGSASLDRLQTKWHGDTEKAFRRAFEEAAKAGAILLLDEVDALLCDRGTMVASWQISQVNSLLKLLEAPPVPVVLCTNFLRVLDAAVHRRIQHLVEFPVPDRDQRLALWQKELDRSGLNRLHFLDLRAAAGLPLTGGLIRNAALQFARRIAVYGDDYPADTESLLALARKELPKIDCEVREKRIGF